MGLMIRVPHNHVYICQRLGKFKKQLTPGFNFIFFGIQRIPYKHSLKQKSYSLPNQSAVTKDNVIINIDGVLYYKITDPYLASYGALQPQKYTYKLSQTITRSQIGKLTLEETFQSRQLVNSKILQNLKNATQPWGINCIRYYKGYFGKIKYQKGFKFGGIIITNKEGINYQKLRQKNILDQFSLSNSQNNDIVGLGEGIIIFT